MLTNTVNKRKKKYELNLGPWAVCAYRKSEMEYRFSDTAEFPDVVNFKT
jgi:hypothetical protein